MSRSLCCLVSVLALILSAPAALAEGFITRLLDRPVPGGVAVVPLGEAPAAPVATYRDRRVMVLREDGRRWIAVVGIALDTPPGSTQQLVVEDGQGSRVLAFQVGSKEYAAQHIRLKNRRQVNPEPEDLRRIERELAEQMQAYRAFRPGTPSNVMLGRPVPGRLSSPFGLRRYFNGEPRNPHSGLDFAAPAGTPVRSPAAGKVVLVGDYFFNGKTVFVDHGQGFISMFCHLSRIDVQPGQDVARGQTLGAVGATGRATGPHLHWNVSLNDTRVDPAIFIGAFEP